MEFDRHLASIQAYLLQANNVVGPLDKLTLEENHQSVQLVVDQLKSCILTIPKEELRKCHLFLLLNTDLALVHEERLQCSDWSHLLGISTIISKDVFLALSIQLMSEEDFLFETIAFMPLPIAIQLTAGIAQIYSKHYLNNTFKRVDMLCCAIYHNLFTRNCGNVSAVFTDVYYLNLLRSVLHNVDHNADKADSFTFMELFQTTLFVLKIFLIKESPFKDNVWAEFYAGSLDSVEEVSNDGHELLVEARKMLIRLASIMCCKLSERVNDEACPETYFDFNQKMGELAHECIFKLKNVSVSSYPGYNELLEVLSKIDRKPKNIFDKIREATFSDLCSNSILESENQHLWLKALLCHSEGLKREEAVKALDSFVHLLDTQDIFVICDTLISSSENVCESAKTLGMNSFNRLSQENKLLVLEKRIQLCGRNSIFNDQSCGFEVLETLNKLVAQGDIHCQDQLLQLAFECPYLVVKHILLKAIQNQLFSTSVMPGILKTLKCIFTCPVENSESDIYNFSNETELILSDIMANGEGIEKECGGIQNLVKQLLGEDIVSVGCFLHSCVLPALYTCSKELKETKVMLLLYILLDVQTEVRNWEKCVNLPTLLFFLGQLLEHFSHNLTLEDSEGNIVRQTVIRNLEKIFSVSGCVDSIQGSEKDWLLKELSALSPENRHHFRVLVPEWMLFYDEKDEEIIFTLAKVAPRLHVAEWQQLLECLPCLQSEDSSKNFQAVFIFCSAVNLVVRAVYQRGQGKLMMNLKGCFRNLGSVVKSCMAEGFADHHAPLIFRLLLNILEFLPESEQFELAMFTLPLMLELIDHGCQNDRHLATFGRLILTTSLRCIRRDLGRHLKKASTMLMSNPAPAK